MLVWCAANSSQQHAWAFGPIVQQFLAKHHIPQVRQLPCLPDMVPCDSFLFLWIKNTLKGKWFEDVETVKLNMNVNFWRASKKSIRGASSSGRATGISVSKQKGPTSKGVVPCQGKFGIC
jgi:hypothetical protein